MTLPAITCRQPHAALIVVDAKVENRAALTKYRGEIAIHAGKTPDQAELDRVQASGMAGPFTVFGAVLAVADLVDCHLSAWDADDGAICCPPYGRRMHHTVPAYHLVFANVRPLARPVECRGQLPVGWRVPADVEKAVRDQLPPMPEEA